MNSENPYKPTSDLPPEKRISLRPFILLNAGLLALPLVMFAGIYTWLILENWLATLENNGDPVTYQHFFYVEPSGGLLLIFYFAVPNFLLFMIGQQRAR